MTQFAISYFVGRKHGSWHTGSERWESRERADADMKRQLAAEKRFLNANGDQLTSFIQRVVEV